MISDIFVVLVRTLYPSNIGSAARAVANMGAKQLILIDPQCEVNSKSKQNAAGSQEPLEQRRQYASWEEFYASEGKGYRIALTRRQGKNRKVLSLKKVLEEIFSDNNDSTLTNQDSHLEPLPLYLFFGPEDDGLSAQDMSLVNVRAYLPTFGPFASLNLSQAVLLSLYIVQDYRATHAHLLNLEPEPEIVSLKNSTTSSPAPLYFPDQSIRDWLEAMGFDITARKASAYLTLKRLLLQNWPSDTELQVLDAILQQNIRKLRDNSNK